VQGNLKELSEQVEILKSTLSQAGNDHESHQAENRGLHKELEKKRLRLDDMRRTLASNRRKLESDYLHLDSLEQKAKELEALQSLEGKRMVEVRVGGTCFQAAAAALQRTP
jgi:chromosome segregation ATPase